MKQYLVWVHSKRCWLCLDGPFEYAKWISEDTQLEPACFMSWTKAHAWAAVYGGLVVEAK